MNIETLHAGCGSFPNHLQQDFDLSSAGWSPSEDVAVPAEMQREGEESDLGVAWVKKVHPELVRASTWCDNASDTP